MLCITIFCIKFTNFKTSRKYLTTIKRKMNNEYYFNNNR